jgi:hypothetical protein
MAELTRMVVGSTDCLAHFDHVRNRSTAEVIFHDDSVGVKKDSYDITTIGESIFDVIN